ncbi:MAG TPA: phosphoribosylanthranilate isomerase [Chryseolinea sp.]|nr:phosphoribosylanthranilate isomerase [Chryseolinea sp.]
MRDAENILSVASLAPQYLGFIFYTKSPRFVGDDFKIPSGMPSSIKRVGVFVNDSNETILNKSKSLGLDLVQLHGNETPLQCEELKSTELGVIKVFSIDDDFHFDKTKAYKEVVDYFLFDTKGKHYGGNARTFDWKILNQYDQEIPFFLSGGLSPENISSLGDILKMNLHALDLNSGVEISPGLKDPAKIKTVVASLKHQNS